MQCSFGSKCLDRRVVIAPLIILLLATSSVWCQNAGLPVDRGSAFGWSLALRTKARKPIRPIRQMQSPPVTSDGDDVVRVETDLVINDILVFDKLGRPVTGLSKDDFIVSEDAALQEVAVFSHDGNVLSRSVTLIIDHSVSQLPYIERSIEAAKVLVDKLNPNDRMAIVTDDISLISGPTSDKTLLKESLEVLKTTTMAGNIGKSQQYSALMAVLNELSDSGGARPVIIFQTDGDQTGSLLTGRTYKGVDAAGFERFSYDDIVETAKTKGATVYSVFCGVSLNGVPMSEKLSRAQTAIEAETRLWQAHQGIVPVSRKTKINQTFLKKTVISRLRDELAVSGIATLTGGLAQTLESPGQAGEVYERILSDMNNRYAIGYYPTNESRDDKLREIKIEVRGHPEYTIMGRKSYLPPKDQLLSR